MHNRCPDAQIKELAMNLILFESDTCEVVITKQFVHHEFNDDRALALRLMVLQKYLLPVNHLLFALHHLHQIDHLQ